MATHSNGNNILPADRLAKIMKAVAESWGFKLDFLPLDENLKGRSEFSNGQVIELSEFDRKVFLSGPTELMDRMKDTVNKVAGIVLEQELENVSLTEEIVERYQQLSLLFDMSDRLGAARDNQSRIVAILETAIEAVGAVGGYLMMKGSEPRSCWINKGELDSESLLALSSEVIGQQRYLLEEKKHFALPLRVEQGNIIGALVLGPKREAVYRSGDIKLLTTLSSYASLLLESGRLYEDLESLFFSTIKSMIEAVDAKDPSTRGHSERVRRYSHIIGEGLGFNTDEMKSLELAALLHDVGKIGLPDIILNNEKEYLSESQWELVRMHPEIGVSILSHVAQLKSILPAIGQHHERYDGQGYPNGIDGENITLFARIIAVADSFDAMTMSRTYRTKFSLNRALTELNQNSGSQFDPQLVTLFIANVKNMEIKLDN
jgi:HD-GYP domain-containing protein (c-di-GMP phosphodiesterase class II)